MINPKSSLLFFQMISTPMVPIKFLHLKLLEIYLAELLAFPPNYDFFSLVSFLDGSPALETFILHVCHFGIKIQLMLVVWGLLQIWQDKLV